MYNIFPQTDKFNMKKITYTYALYAQYTTHATFFPRIPTKPHISSQAAVIVHVFKRQKVWQILTSHWSSGEGEKATTNKDIVVTLQEAAGKVHTPEKEQDIGGEGNELQVYLRDHIKEADLVHTHTHTHTS